MVTTTLSWCEPLQISPVVAGAHHRNVSHYGMNSSQQFFQVIADRSEDDHQRGDILPNTAEGLPGGLDPGSKGIVSLSQAVAYFRFSVVCHVPLSSSGREYLGEIKSVFLSYIGSCMYSIDFRPRPILPRTRFRGGLPVKNESMEWQSSVGQGLKFVCGKVESQEYFCYDFC